MQFDCNRLLSGWRCSDGVHLPIALTLVNLQDFIDDVSPDRLLPTTHPTPFPANDESLLVRFIMPNRDTLQFAALTNQRHRVATP